jgi:hypothetical protein
LNPSFGHFIDAHRYKHKPKTQLCLALHFFLQAPQLAGSVKMSVQAIPHMAELSGQLVVQAPATHAASPLVGAGQTFPHMPQFWVSVLVSTQAPPQLVEPAAHLKPHAPIAQVAVAFAGASQAVVQDPQ